MTLHRRSILLAAMTAACATGAGEDGAHALVRRAVAAAGGEAALRRARVLAWTGQAIIHAGDRTIEIGVDTVVEPFVSAHSETWLLSQGRASTRVLEIDPMGGWATRNGERTPLPETQTAHERQQYALYGLMRLVTLLDPGVRLTVPQLVMESAPPSMRAALDVEHPQAPRTRLIFDADARLTGARNSVLDPDGGAPIAQNFTFEGTVEGGGVRWPRKMTILQNDRPFFELTLATFTPRERR